MEKNEYEKSGKNRKQIQVLLLIVVSQIMTDEKWKDFPVICGRKFSKYEVSSLGSVRNKRSGHISSTNPNYNGYVRNGFLDDEGNSKHILGHVIVARAFLDKPKSDDLTVDHINRERADNRAINLRWATRKQQSTNSDKSKSGAIGQPVIQYTIDMGEIKRWPNIMTAAKELGMCNVSIGKACKGKLKTSGGFKWAYERQDLDGEIWKEYISGTLSHGSVKDVTNTLSLEPMRMKVSNMGRIKLPNYHIVYGSKAAGGYLKYGEPQKLVHVIIAEAFLPNLEKKPEVNHKDKDRRNNKVENLEWATRSEQAIHSHKNSNLNRYHTSRAVK